MSSKWVCVWAALFLPIAALPLLCAQKVVSSVPGETAEQYEARMKWWRDAKFGIFIHWGPVSLVGTEIGWSRGRQIPVEVYDNLYKKFNPKKFNPKEWARLFKDAGAKYVVIVTKHHDGFSMFDSALTDYDCMSTPAKRDFVGELVKACRQEGLRVMLYYSLIRFATGITLTISLAQTTSKTHRDIKGTSSATSSSYSGKFANFARNTAPTEFGLMADGSISLRNGKLKSC
jgi:alpha-L-fucosidase